MFDTPGKKESYLHLLKVDMKECTPEELSDYLNNLIEERTFQMRLDMRLAEGEKEGSQVVQDLTKKIEEINALLAERNKQ